MARRERLDRRGQSAISSIVRRQPRHQPVFGSIRHTPVQGEGTVFIRPGKQDGAACTSNFLALCCNAPYVAHQQPAREALPRRNPRAA